MADLAPNAAQLIPGSDALFDVGTSGEALAAGDWLYLKAADTRLWRAASTADATAEVVGQTPLAVPAAGQPVRYQKGGTAVQGAAAAPVKGTIYVLSANAGKACPAADLNAGKRVTILGVGDAANGIKMQLHRSGITV